MPITEDKKALNWAAENPTDERTPKILEAIGLGGQDLKAWGWANKNPLDARALEIRGVIYNKMANYQKPVEESGLKTSERMVVKNLLDQDISNQKSYLEKKGYQTKLEGKELLVKKPIDSQWKKIDPSKVEFADALDILSDIGEGAANALAVGSKAAGTLLTPVTGGSSILAGSVLGGASTAGYEAGKQALGKALGVRETYNPSQIANAGLIGAAVPLGLGVGGKMLKGLGGIAAKAIEKVYGKVKPNAEEIKKAAEIVGGKATPGQLIESDAIKKLENAQVESVGQMGGFFVRKQASTNKEAAKDVAESLVSDASKLTAFESGEKAGNEILKSVENKLAPAEKIYQKYEGIFSRNAYTPNLSAFLDKLQELKNQFRLDDSALKSLQTIENKANESVKNLDDLKLFRTWLSDNFGKDIGDKSGKRIIAQLRPELTRARSDTLLNLAETRGNEFFKTAKEEIEQADSIYKNTISDLTDTLFKGKNLKGSPKASVQQFLDKTPETARVNKLFSVNDPAKIKSLAQSYPEAYETLKSAKIQDILNRSMTGENISPQKLSTTISKLPKETATLLFGEDGLAKANALKTFLDSTPPLVNTSRTEVFRQIMTMTNPATQAWGLGRAAWYNFITGSILGKNAITKLGEKISAPATIGATEFMIRSGLEKPKGD